MIAENANDCVVLSNPPGIAPTVGTMSEFKVFGVPKQMGREQSPRHYRIRFTGQCDASGNFTLTIPYINGAMRGGSAWETDNSGFPLSTNAKLDLDVQLDDAGSFMQTVIAQQSFASQGTPARVSAYVNNAALSYAAAAITLVAGPVRFKISSATALGKFQAELVVLVSA